MFTLRLILHHLTNSLLSYTTKKNSPLSRHRRFYFKVKCKFLKNLSTREKQKWLNKSSPERRRWFSALFLFGVKGVEEKQGHIPLSSTLWWKPKKNSHRGKHLNIRSEQNEKDEEKSRLEGEGFFAIAQNIVIIIDDFHGLSSVLK